MGYTAAGGAGDGEGEMAVKMTVWAPSPLLGDVRCGFVWRVSVFLPLNIG